jgi:hypothetical protein
MFRDLMLGSADRFRLIIQDHLGFGQSATLSYDQSGHNRSLCKDGGL